MRINESNKAFYSKVLKTAGPITFQYLMLALVAVSDAFMLGSVEQNQMSAVSLATQVQFIQNIIIGAVVATTSILGSQYWGKRDREAMKKIVCIGLYFSVFVSCITFIGCTVFPRALMTVFTNESTLIEIGARYLRIAGWSYLLTGISQILLTTMKVSEHQNETALISSVAVVLNIILNAILIFGLFGGQGMGVEGAAIATLIARIVELCWVVIKSIGKDYIHPDLSSFVKIDRLLLGDFVKCAMPLLGACLFWGIGFSAYTAFMGHLGEDAAAANSVTAVIRDMICCMTDGLAAGAGIIVGNALGAGELEKGKEYGGRFVRLAFIIGGISTLLMLAFTPLIMQVVQLSDGARGYLKGMMFVMAFYMIGRAVNTVIINGIFGAGGDTLFDLYSLAVAMWCLAVPLAALGTFFLNFPVIAVYACTCLDEVGKIPWVLYHYKKYKWVKDLTR